MASTCSQSYGGGNSEKFMYTFQDSCGTQVQQQDAKSYAVRTDERPKQTTHTHTHDNLVASMSLDVGKPHMLHLERVIRLQYIVTKHHTDASWEMRPGKLATQMRRS